MLLRRLQNLISGIYDLAVPQDVGDFVVTDRRLLPDEQAASHTDEQLLVACGEDTLDIALYLDAGLLKRLEAADPTDALHAGNVADYLTAVEGVSHFVCVAWHARHDRDVSLLALEMQAEIDKYLATYLLLRRQWPERFPAELHDLLFTRARVDTQLAGAREGLYRTASDHAACYCRAIDRRLRRQRRGGEKIGSELDADLKRFYRMPESAKFAAIRRSGGSVRGH